MPEFIMETDGPVTYPNGPFYWHNLDAFTQGYIEALFFTSCDPSASMVEIAADHEFIDGSIPADAGFSDLHPASLISIIQDCVVFQCTNATLLAAAYHGGKYDAAQAGRDFWYTRCGHGCGYWDREELNGEPGDYLASIEAPAQWNPSRRAEFIRLRGKTTGDHLSDAAREAGNVDSTWGAAADGAASPTGYGFVFVQ